MSDLVKSDPHFFRPVTRALLLGIAVLLVLAFFLPAPLDPPADPSRSPNPAKSAWFLIWIQELVSHGTALIYVAVGLAALLVALRFLSFAALDHARWFPHEHRVVSVVVILAAVVVLALTCVGLFLRGPDWRLVLPF